MRQRKLATGMALALIALISGCNQPKETAERAPVASPHTDSALVLHVWRDPAKGLAAENEVWPGTVITWTSKAKDIPSPFYIHFTGDPDFCTNATKGVITSVSGTATCNVTSDRQEFHKKELRNYFISSDPNPFTPGPTHSVAPPDQFVQNCRAC